MKLFKYLYPLVIIISFLLLYYSDTPSTKLSPVSPQTKFSQKLNHALFLAKINPVNIVYQSAINKVSFSCQYNTNTYKVILSTQQNPYYQITTLQQLLKKDRISNNNTIKIIDLSINHPYATQ